jgi:hypothetical protein
MRTNLGEEVDFKDIRPIGKLISLGVTEVCTLREFSLEDFQRNSRDYFHVYELILRSIGTIVESNKLNKLTELNNDWKRNGF